MARGGSFGGGNRGGGFSSGGRSGGFSSGRSTGGSFSSGNRSSSSGGFSSNNFSSYKKSSGATPASNPTPVHTNKSSFLTGAILGSVLSSGRNKNNTVHYGGVSKNDVFPEVAGSNYTPKRPDPNKGREYMLCEYCGSEYNDLNVTKCQSCGAKTTRKREEIKKAGEAQSTNFSSSAATDKQKSKNKKALTVFIVIAAVVIFIFVMSVIFGGTDDFAPITYDWEGGNFVTYKQTASLNNWVEGEILSLKVTSATVVGDLNGYGYDESDYYYCVATVEIKNNTSGDYKLYISDLTLKVGSNLYVASGLGENGQRVFSERSEDGYMTVAAGEYLFLTLIFPIHDYQPLSALSLEYREFSSGGNGSFMGAYLFYLN